MNLGLGHKDAKLQSTTQRRSRDQSGRQPITGEEKPQRSQTILSNPNKLVDDRSTAGQQQDNRWITAGQPLDNMRSPINKLELEDNRLSLG